MPYTEWCRFYDPSRWAGALRQRLMRIIEVFRPAQVLHLVAKTDSDMTGTLALEVLQAACGPTSHLSELEREIEALRRELERREDLARQVLKLEARIESLRRADVHRQANERVREAMRTLLPAGVTVLAVTKGDSALVEAQGLDVWHFPQGPGGVYAGYHPADSSEAVGHLEALRARGAQYLVVPRASRWWLDHYEAFRSHLDDNYRRLLDHDDCVIFSLVPGDAESAADARTGEAPGTEDVP